MNVKEIIEEWLKIHGYDGLCHDDCGCIIGDLMPCDYYFRDCKPGHKRTTDNRAYEWEVVEDDPTT